VSTVVLTDDDDVPRVVHWGAPLAEPVGAAALDALTDAPVPQGSLDRTVPLSLLPELARGWAAYGGIAGHRHDGTGWAPLLRRTSSSSAGSRYTWTGSDVDAGLTATITVELDAHGVVQVGASIANDGTTPYALGSLAPVLPLPGRAQEVLTLTGRWIKEMQDHRTPLGPIAVVRENRRGKTSAESSPTIAVGTTGFSEERGELWLAHLAWSGDHRAHAEALSDGRRFLSVAELLLPGEVLLQPGESYAAPMLVATWSASGLTTASQQLHAFVRARPTHPVRPRPVLLNTWEAVYFNHDLDELTRLADAAAEVGVERFVLDDGWFSGRGDDTSSLGDWHVDEHKYPDGLDPLIDHVTGLGMEFGLWVEPEMVNPDSDLYRAHPDWALGIAGQPLVLGRNQLVLDLGRPEVSAYLLERLDALLSAHDIAYLKWDMNRDLVAAGGRDGSAGVHRQTLALYALLDELRRRHPSVEIESCSSGGGRVDLGIAARTDRFWTSDCNDAVERQRIQRGFSYLLPPELMGAHVGGPWSHTTARTQTLTFRAGTAIFGHLGFEWNLLNTTEEERASIRGIIETHKRLRGLLHSGLVVRTDHPDPSALVHGIVAQDGGEALFAYAQLTTTDASLPLPARLPGLDPARSYRVSQLLLPGPQWDPGKHHPSWYDEPVVVRGDLLGTIGVPMGVHVPEQVTLIHVEAV
jgi:alpha-galactosidase